MAHWLGQVLALGSVWISQSARKGQAMLKFLIIALGFAGAMGLFCISMATGSPNDWALVVELFNG